jgi:hypothetical protein
LKRYTVVAILSLAVIICIPFGTLADDVEEIVDVFADYVSEAEPAPAAAEPVIETEEHVDADTTHIEPEPNIEAEEFADVDAGLILEAEERVDVDTISLVETEAFVDADTLLAELDEAERLAAAAALDQTLELLNKATEEAINEAEELAAIAVDTVDTATGWLSFFTARAGYLLVADDRSNIFFTAEFGLFRESGLFISADIGGGWYHYGGGINIGYAFPVYGSVKSFVVGGTGGYYNIALPYNILNVNGDLLWREYGKSTAFCGLFWKATWQNVDFTNRLLFGTKSNLYRHDFTADNYYKQSGRHLNLVYSVGLGYTITRRKGK